MTELGDAMGDGYRIELEAYHGPMDLLLYLVKRHEIDLHDIPMAKLTEQYMAHLELIRRIDLEKAGDFLVMAATLMEIKSRMLMPLAAASDEADAGDDSQAGSETSGDDTPASDPRFELVQQLLAYKRFKDRAVALERRGDHWAQRVPVSAGWHKQEQTDEQRQQRELDVEDVHVMDLCEAFGRLLESVGQRGDHEVTYDDTPISLHAEDIVDRLARDGNMTLAQIFVGRQSRAQMIGLFLAMLELVRNRKVTVVQETSTDQPDKAGEIQLQLLPEDQWIDPDHIEADDAEPVALPSDGDTPADPAQFDWPSQADRRRYERRLAMREKRKQEGDQKHPDQHAEQDADRNATAADAAGDADDDAADLADDDAFDDDDFDDDFDDDEDELDDLDDEEDDDDEDRP